MGEKVKKTDGRVAEKEGWKWKEKKHRVMKIRERDRWKDDRESEGGIRTKGRGKGRKEGWIKE